MVDDGGGVGYRRQINILAWPLIGYWGNAIPRRRALRLGGILTVIDSLGWAGVALTLATYSQKTMLPLRISAISANLCFITWSLGAGIMQTLALHATLLPFNAYRLSEILWMRRRAERAMAGDSTALDWLRPVMRPTAYTEGSYVFRLGDKVDHLYYLASGEVEFEEVGTVLRKGAIFGEVAFFTRTRERTASARCIGRCEVMCVDGNDFVKLYSQHPAFSLQICRIIANRLLDEPNSPLALQGRAISPVPQPAVHP